MKNTTKAKIIKKVYEIEKQIFFITGIRLLLYRAYVEVRAEKLQEALNKKHGTNYKYNDYEN